MPIDELIGIGLMYGPIRPLTKAIGSSAAITVKGGEDGGSADLVHRRQDDFSERPAGSGTCQRWMFPPPRWRRLQDADGEDEGEERHPVEGESPGPGGEEGGGQGKSDGDADDQGLPPARAKKTRARPKAVAKTSF